MLFTHSVLVHMWCIIVDVCGCDGVLVCAQVNARLYAFDAATHSWKERGRGDIRLNDACQSEGVFQSRLGQNLHCYCIMYSECTCSRI